ncbi:MAG: D-aminoacyl-tRNA deacylase [Candidatus Woesearchaeota archaeon]
MDIAIIITTPDYAGINIEEHLLLHNFTKTGNIFENNEIYNFKNKINNITIYTTDKRCIYCENIDKEINADIFIFPTTHRSSSGTHSLSCHTQGNWGKADLGGSPNNLGICPAILIKEIFKELNKKGSELDEEITMEATHHGPDIDKPVIFCEIGSDESQWKRKDLGKLWADIIMEVLNKPLPELETAIGIGGSHYCTNFNRIQLKNNIAIGHICPKYALEYLNEEMIIQAINKTIPKPKIAILDWKGIGERKQEIISILNKLNIKIKRTKDF